jgi:hypothetical protein
LVTIPAISSVIWSLDHSTQLSLTITPVRLLRLQGRCGLRNGKNKN